MTTVITVPRLRAYDGPALLCRGPFLFVLVRVAAGIVVAISADVG